MSAIFNPLLERLKKVYTRSEAVVADRLFLVPIPNFFLAAPMLPRELDCAIQAGWGGDLLAGGWDQRLTLLATNTEGERLHWQVDVGAPISSIVMASRCDGSGQEQALANTLSSGKDVAVVATLDGDLIAFDSQGLQRWHLDAGGPVTHLGTIEGSTEPLVLAGIQDGRLLALTVTEDNAQVRWERKLGQGAPVWAAAQVIGNADPEIIAGMGAATPRLALLSLTGALLWQVSTPAPVAAVATVDLDGNGDSEILAGLASGEIQVFDSQGRVRGSVHAGLSVWELESARDGAAFALADVVAWRLNPFAGPAGGNWLPPPAMVPLPYVVSPVDSGGSGAGDDQDGQATLIFLGDVMPGRSVERQLARYGPDYPWDGLRPLLIDADLAVGNLEGLLTTQGQPLDKPYLIRAHPRWHETLAAARLDLVTLANNHALDFGEVGLDQTLTILHDAGIGAVGIGGADDPAQAQRPHFFDLNGVRVAVLAYAASRWNGSEDMPATQRVAWAGPETVSAGVHAAREEADVVVVLLHAGTEYADQPSSDQLTAAHAAVDAGADLVVGHHPHVTQTVERYGQGLIVYSLGDALFDIPRPAAMLGHLLRVHVTGQGLTQAELWPFWIEESIRPRLLDDGRGLPRVDIIYP
jgi:poly-gamma-glutamate synthesis protein (capsule biosynthesis protein)